MMNPLLSRKSIFLASVLAPLVIGVPVLLIALIGVVLAFPSTNGSSQDFGKILGFAVNAAVPLYLLLVAGCLLISFALEYLGRLTRGALFVAAAAAAVTVSISISCDWSTSCDMQDFLLNFGLFGFVSALGLAAVVLSWWWLARKISLR